MLIMASAAAKFGYHVYLYTSLTLWSTIDSPTLLTFFQHLSLSDLINLIIINLTHLIQLIINLSHKSHLTNLISLSHLTVTNNNLLALTLYINKQKFVTMMLFSQFSEYRPAGIGETLSRDGFTVSTSIYIVIVSSKLSGMNFRL